MRKPTLRQLAAFASITPFLVGFSPPKESGTHVSASAGGGRALYAPGCATPRLIDYADQQAGIYHRTPPMGGLDTRLGLGADFNRYASREKECSEDQCANASPDWKEKLDLYSATPYATLDWKWAGLGAGLHIPMTINEADASDRPEDGSWIPIPIKYSLRLGREDKLYFSAEAANGMPAKSGSAIAQYGVGGRMRDTEVWLGTDEPGRHAGLSGRIGQGFGPFRLRLAGTLTRLRDHHSERSSNDTDSEDAGFRIDMLGYSYSAGLDYILPW